MVTFRQAGLAIFAGFSNIEHFGARLDLQETQLPVPGTWYLVRCMVGRERWLFLYSTPGTMKILLFLVTVLCLL